MRGGPQNLGLNGLLEMTVAWYEINMMRDQALIVDAGNLRHLLYCCPASMRSFLTLIAHTL